MDLKKSNQPVSFEVREWPLEIDTLGNYTVKFVDIPDRFKYLRTTILICEGRTGQLMIYQKDLQ